MSSVGLITHRRCYNKEICLLLVRVKEGAYFHKEKVVKDQYKDDFLKQIF